MYTDSAVSTICITAANTGISVNVMSTKIKAICSDISVIAINLQVVISLLHVLCLQLVNVSSHILLSFA